MNRNLNNRIGICWSVPAMLLLCSTALFAQDTDSSPGPLSSSEFQRSKMILMGTAPRQLSNSAVDSSGNSLTNDPTRSAGLLFGYSFAFTKRFSVEADWAPSRNSQRFNGPSGTLEIQGDMNQLTVEGQYALPHYWRIEPFAEAGAGSVLFAPTDRVKSENPIANSQSKPTFLYGGGADIRLGRGIAFRTEFRGLRTKSPTYLIPAIGSTSTLHVVEPLIGLSVAF